MRSSSRSSCPLQLVKLPALMELTTGRPEVVIGLIDGPVATDHPDLRDANIRDVSRRSVAGCTMANSAACMHGTSVAGILVAKRESAAPAICPGCTLLVRPIFGETGNVRLALPVARPEELASAMFDCMSSGARVLNLSIALARPSMSGRRDLHEALDYAARRGIIVVAAAGNQGDIGSTVITRHTGVIPVVAYDLHGRPVRQSNFSGSIGRRGLGAPGDGVTSLGTGPKQLTFDGTSAAAPFVTGTIALLWSLFPSRTAAEIMRAVKHTPTLHRNMIVPPLLNAWAAYRVILKAKIQKGGEIGA